MTVSEETYAILQWLKRNASAETNPVRRNAFVEAYNAALKIVAAKRFEDDRKERER
ncbi:MAG TPA: hypothetical protein VGH47_02090 [Xanthobacteraceae bacterium]|jgi:hypothetical protein